jgi:hypothetical protein
VCRSSRIMGPAESDESKATSDDNMRMIAYRIIVLCACALNAVAAFLRRVLLLQLLLAPSQRCLPKTRHGHSHLRQCLWSLCRKETNRRKSILPETHLQCHERILPICRTLSRVEDSQSRPFTSPSSIHLFRCGVYRYSLTKSILRQSAPDFSPKPNIIMTNFAIYTLFLLLGNATFASARLSLLRVAPVHAEKQITHSEFGRSHYRADSAS